ncbi:MAG: M20/M25/M40 family metallo-hydrolase [Nitrospinaceae bacterium]|jgi:acetylornithine deacetylase/succinyl-diaminopimelate desuccinylase-like protein|nr:M20/M25/M40 family metallo-hydrolase [Nitrospinaceae bacterium]MBT3822209.1 M20/M25/M40 family metallo-hydrolase [Nitrospinaceae bacterium]MBT4428962.1 M20/M25/M40 family metallo-hydrolase [Nitrospinaceae bacterium]MBT5369395.1 M20/M25/M40 family metallo-hydrolase [Nitrospinaceae bacterium]MBT5949382.1 M20/M25/M40 family metallo-hydrolase [Nitrospinaceae bacterium]
MSENAELDSIFQYIDNHTEEIVSDLQELCRQPSISTTHTGIEEMAGLVHSRLERAGLNAAFHETDGHPIVTGKLEGASLKTLLFYNHYDVQPAEPLEEWTSPPFEARVVDGHVIARGATDNKGNIISRLAAFEAFLAVRGKLPCSIKYLIEGEEEIGSPSLENFIINNREMLEADGCIWEDNTVREHIPVLALGNKGLCYLELRCRTANVDFHSSNAQMYENAAWRIAWALASMKDQDENVLVEGFYDGIEPLTEKEEELVNKIPPYDGKTRRENFELRRFALDMPDEELARRHLVHPSFNIAGFDAGYTGEGVKTIVSGRARAKIDCRLVVGQTPEKIHDCIRRHLDKNGFEDIETELLFSSLPAKSDPESDVVKACAESSRRLYGEEPIINPFGNGSTPTWIVIKHLDLPLSSTGVGCITSRTHSANENVKIEHLIMGAKYMAGICESFGTK